MAEDQRPFAGRVAIVTGAGQGIGNAIATRLAGDGMTLALVDVNAEALSSLAAELGESVQVRTYAADLTDPDATVDTANRVLADLGRVDVLVNNAGRRGIHDFADYPLDDWNSTIALNLTAPFLLSRTVVPGMIANGGGSIINVTSIAADLAFRQRSAYNASKAGLVGLTRSIAVECAKDGIRANGVAPGVIETPINAAYLRTGPESVAIIEGTPTGSFGQPEDIAAAVHFLCLPEARFINGQIIHVDGGWTAGKGY
jgi:NAD(P)-dependent dehydrogenase (short-subunit alcohol dehydrogenase family)